MNCKRRAFLLNVVGSLRDTSQAGEGLSLPLGPRQGNVAGSLRDTSTADEGFSLPLGPRQGVTGHGLSVLHLATRLNPATQPGSAVALLFLVLASCSRGPARIYPPDVDAAGVAAAAIESLDRDGNQTLSREELSDCPGMRDMFARYDSNGDGQVAADEIAGRIAELSRKGMTGLYSVACRVTLDGVPLGGATVSLLPEPFFGGALQPAQGITSRRGLVRPASEGVVTESSGPPRGVQPGVYRVAVTHPDKQLPERYTSGAAPRSRSFRVLSGFEHRVRTEE